MPTRPIEQVLAAHADEFMAIEGVAGIYQGALEDGTPCLKVLTVIGRFKDRHLIPDILEGYRVLLEDTDEIRPLGDTRD